MIVRANDLCNEDAWSLLLIRPDGSVVQYGIWFDTETGRYGTVDFDAWRGSGREPEEFEVTHEADGTRLIDTRTGKDCGC